MIYKVLSRHSPSYQSLIDYIIKGAKECREKPHIITHNLKGNQGQKGWAKQYMVNEAFRKQMRSNSVMLYHEILSFGRTPKDKITQDMLNDITQKFYELRGKDGIYLSAVHYEKDHIHIHTCTSGLKFRTGQAQRFSKSDMQKLKTNLQEYYLAKYPQLEKSAVQHNKGKEYVTDREYQKNKKIERSLHKDEIKEKIKTCFEQSTSKQNFLERIRNEGLPHYERNGIPQGVLYGDNMKFRFSRLDLSKEQFEELPTDTSREDRAMDEIRSIRESQDTQSRNNKDEIENDFDRSDIGADDDDMER